MIKVGDIKFFKYYTSLKTMTESTMRRGDENEGREETAHRVSIKINKQPFSVQTYTRDEAREIRKTLPQFV